MKNINLKTKKGFIFASIFLLIVLSLLVFLNKGLKEKALKIFEKKEENVVDIVSSQDYKKYESQIISYFEGKQIINFSFLYKNDLEISRGIGSESRWFRVLDKNNKNNITLYFTYEGGRGFSSEDYINDIAKDDKNFKIQDVKFLDNSSSTIKYVFFENKNLEYFVEEIKNEKGEPWLAIVENIDAKDGVSQNIARDIIRSFEVK